MLLPEQLGRPAQQTAADAAAQPDDELAVFGLQSVLERSSPGVPGGEQLLGVRQQGGPGRGESRPVPAAGEQRRPHERFEGADVFAQRRLGEVQSGRSPGEVLFFGSGDEAAQRPQVRIHADELSQPELDGAAIIGWTSAVPSIHPSSKA